MPDEKNKQSLREKYADSSRILSSLNSEWRRARIIRWVFAGSMAALLLFVGLILWIMLVHEPARRRREPAEVDLWSWDNVLLAQETGGRLLGEFISREYPDKSLLILIPPEEYKEDVEEATLEGMLEGLGEREEEVRIVSVPEDSEESSPAGYFDFPAESFDQATRPFPDIDVVVSIIGLPYNPGKMIFWKRRPRPELILINAEIFRLSELVRGGGISAVMARRPYLLDEEKILTPDSERLWVLITPDNLAEIQERHPNFFVSRKDEIDEPVSLPEALEE